jgi:glycosyltransferase involved in cell wall biosynthesis
MTVDFTVAIPTYNGACRLPKVLEKLQAQTNVEHLSWEIIIVDNNSTDGTAELVQEYQINWKYPFQLRYVFEPEQGLAFARARGVKEAKGEFVGFLDDDNLPAPTWISAAYTFGQEHANSGAFASQIHGLFEAEPSDSLKKILFYLAINERGSQPMLYEPSKKGVPPGAGLVVRRRVWLDCVPNRLLLIGRVGKSMLAGEDAEALLYIYRAGWEIWYNPAMEIEHIIPKWRLEKNYLILLMRGIGLSRYYIRILMLKQWQYFFATLIYVINDIRKLVLYFIRYHRQVMTGDIVATCEIEMLTATLISPLYFLWVQINKLLR